ncbi:MAG TPA: hypothetical protein VNE21_02265 [Mycobacteriales bacterium]|nr:hypothetical protein [Mycobacteriales bacterium]
MEQRADYAEEPDPERVVVRVLQPGETVHVRARALAGVIAVTDHRLLVAERTRLALDIPLGEVRRIEFDIERTRPATLVIVPEHPAQEPQVLAIPLAELSRAVAALSFIGERIAGTE